ncbi:MAG: EAL domain-containing protein, partial [bacterium]
RFGLFLPVNDVDDIRSYLLGRLEDLTDDFVVNDTEVNQEFTLGIARYPDDGQTLDTLVTSANRALVRAKNDISQTVALFKESDRETLIAKINAKERISRALDQERINVSYQPIKDTVDGSNLMHEALLRFETEEGEELSTDVLKEVVHEPEITRRLDQWVIRKAISDFSDRIGTESFPLLAVNMFPNTIIDHEMFSTIHDIIDEKEFPPEKLVIEIPETLLQSHREKATKNVRQAAEQYNYKFAIDDFGVGHGSFKSLSTLPLNYLKIDGSFVKDLSNNPVEQKFVEMTAGLSQQMDLDVIAEWVETQETADLLEELGIQLQQGYYYSDPVTIRELEESNES